MICGRFWKENNFKNKKSVIEGEENKKLDCVPVIPRKNSDELLVEGKAIIDFIDGEKQQDEEDKEILENFF